MRSIFPQQGSTRLRSSWAATLLASLIALAGHVGTALAQSQQTIPLSRGWNLVSLQVGDPAGIPVAQLGAGLDRPSNLTSLWTYDPATREFRSYQPGKPEYPSDLTVVRPGQGFWVQVEGDSVLTVDGPEWTGGFSVVLGWNLIGFPGLTVDDSGGLPLDTVLGSQSDRIPQVWAFQSGSSLSGGQRYVGRDLTARPVLQELRQVVPGRGYWVHATASVDFPNQPILLLPADVDAADAANALGKAQLFPTNGFPRVVASRIPIYANRDVVAAGAEDAPFDLNGNGIVDDPYTQDTLRFEEGVSAQRLSILNTNGLVATWSIPVARASSWLRFSVTNGTTATEVDSVEVTVDRSRLLAGTYRGQFEVRLGSGTRTVAVDLRVPTIAGDYRGAAKTTRVNGSPVSLGKVDLHLSMFMEGDNPATNRFRGVINRDIALLFPQDVFLDGVFYQGNDFSLTTTFEMPPGAPVTPPYDNATDVLNSNPFPFAIHRQVTLQGTRLDADRLSGLYIESISGVLPNSQRITIEGEFDLRRESLSPTRRSIYNGRSPVTPVAIGGTLGAEGVFENVLQVLDDVSIQGVEVRVNAQYPKPEVLTVTLIGPPGLDGIRPTEVLWSPANPFRTGEKRVTSAFDGRNGRGDWTLRIEWAEAPERGQFNGWELNVLGLATYRVSGAILSGGPGKPPLEGVTVTLSGGNILFQTRTDANGRYEFSGLTENLYVLSASQIGYGDAFDSFRLTRSNVAKDPLTLTPLSGGTTEIVALPQWGAAPLQVAFSPRISLDQLAALGTNLVAFWDFGDNQRLTNAPGNVTHTYTTGIHTRATLVLKGSSRSLTNRSPELHAESLAPNPAIAAHQALLTNLAPRTAWVFSVSGVGSVAGPLTLERDTPTAGRVLAESKRDMAAFDIDRPPYGTNTFRPLQEDTAFFVQPGTPYARNTPQLELNRTVDQAQAARFLAPPPTAAGARPARYRLECAVGGTIFGPSPAVAGNLQLKTGRLHP